MALNLHSWNIPGEQSAVCINAGMNMIITVVDVSIVKRRI